MSLLKRTGLSLAAIVVVSSTFAGPNVAHADDSHQHGPDPTESSIEAERGPFETAETSVSRSAVDGFGGGTIYHPSDTSEGNFGAVAIAPGYTASQSSIAWLGPRLASQGFVVFTIDTTTTSDQPDTRADALLAALDYLTSDSDVRDQVDADRLAVMGHSMGGGGALEAAKDDTSLQATIPMTPWDTNKSFPEVSTPTMLIGAQSDSVAPVNSHAQPFYQSLPDDTDKAYLELRGASHFAPNRSNTTIAKYSISWLKRFVDGDERYDQFICPTPSTGTELSKSDGNCPY